MELKIITQALAEGIVDSAKREWNSASLEIEILGASVGTSLEFCYVDSLRDSEYLEGDQIPGLLREYHAFVHQNENAKWNRLFFNLQANGKFEIEFQWDQDLQDQYDRDSQL